jgi:dienelactone hydrolase
LKKARSELPFEVPVDGSTVRGWCRPAIGDAPTVVFLHGWIGYCAGPHRILYELADALAREGLGTARFDFRGRGDSDGRFDQVTFRQAVEDVRAVRGFLERDMGLDCQNMLGMCFGASVGFHCMDLWRRAVLVSPESLSAKRSLWTRARAVGANARIILQKAVAPSSWSRVLTGRTPLRQAASFYTRSGRLPYAPELPHSASSGAGVFLVYGRSDPTAEESLAQYVRHCGRLGVGCLVEWIDGADHSYSSCQAKSRLITRVTECFGKRHDLLDI